MHYKLKATLQNAVARLPERISNPTYYIIQRHFGGYRKPDPTRHIERAVEVYRLAKTGNGSTETFVEIGTGRTLNIPLALWILGAKRVITVDLNRYLRPELVLQSINFIAQNRASLRKYFKGISESVYTERTIRLSRCKSLGEVQSLTSIEYYAPADATRLPIPDATVSCHYSNEVLEHIPAQTLSELLKEARRVLSENGRIVHLIDLSDHFSHSDTRLPRVNFLRFTDAEWRRLAGNRFMYQNRLRVAEYRELLFNAGLKLLKEDTAVDAHSLDLIRSGRLRVDEHFSNMTDTDLAVTEYNVVAVPG